MLLFCARHAILTHRPTKFSRGIAFLYRAYAPWACWWELVEMTRRLFLVGVMVLIRRGQLVQLVYGTIFCAAYLLLQALAMPYTSPGSHSARTLHTSVTVHSSH